MSGSAADLSGLPGLPGLLVLPDRGPSRRGTCDGRGEGHEAAHLSGLDLEIPKLAGGIPTPLKNMKVSWDDDIPNIWKNKTCSKPPTGKEYQNIMGIS